MLGAAFRFAVTGGAATCVHLAVALLLIGQGVPPLTGNACAFAVAFVVSFWGHHAFTFAHHGLAAHRALLRFIIVAGLGFIANETSLMLLLVQSSLPARAALLASTTLAAICTFILSRCWAFRGGVALP